MELHNDDIANLGRRIAVEIGTPVKVEIEGIELPLQSSIVGLEASKYIIIKTPEPLNRIEHKLFKGTGLIIRYINDGTVYAFQCNIMEIITKPLSLLFVEYPKIIQRHDLREQRRVNCHIPVQISSNSKENIGCIVDIAVSGCRCIVKGDKNPDLISCDLDAPLSLKCIIPGNKDVTTLRGKIKNLKRTRREIDIGINFDADLSKDSKKIIYWFLSTIDGIVFK